LSFLVKDQRIPIFAFVMSNHFHLIWQMLGDHKRDNVQRDFLKYTGQQILNVMCCYLFVVFYRKDHRELLAVIIRYKLSFHRSKFFLFSALGQSGFKTIPNCFRRAFCWSSSAK
jgi:hypothetical protein